jgi:hypothetical protein
MNFITKHLPDDLRQALALRALHPVEDRLAIRPPRLFTSKKEQFWWAAEIERQDRPIFMYVGSFAFIAMLLHLFWKGIGLIAGF